MKKLGAAWTLVLEKKAGLASLPAAKTIDAKILNRVGSVLPGSASKKMSQAVTKARWAPRT